MRITGSLAFVAAARAAWVVAKDPENETRRLFLPLKNNIGNDSTGLAFEIQSAQVKSPAGLIETSRVMWEAEGVAVTAAEAMAAQADPEQRSASDEAQEWLREVLAAGPMKASDVNKEARQAGIGDKALRSARERMGIKPHKRGFSGGWWWTLDRAEDALSAEDASKMPEGAQTQKGGIFVNKGILGISEDAQPVEDAQDALEIVTAPSGTLAEGEL
jgi:hypothetical protein